ALIVAETDAPPAERLELCLIEPLACHVLTLPARRSARQGHYDEHMCRNIHTLFNFQPAATEDEVHAAALQYVRKISGFSKPSQANEEAFAHAVEEVAEASRRLLGRLVTTAAPKDREGEAERARA